VHQPQVTFAIGGCQRRTFSRAAQLAIAKAPGLRKCGGAAMISPTLASHPLDPISGIMTGTIPLA